MSGKSLTSRRKGRMKKEDKLELALSIYISPNSSKKRKTYQQQKCKFTLELTDEQKEMLRESDFFCIKSFTVMREGEKVHEVVMHKKYEEKHKEVMDRIFTIAGEVDLGSERLAIAPKDITDEKAVEGEYDKRKEIGNDSEVEDNQKNKTEAKHKGNISRGNRSNRRRRTTRSSERTRSNTKLNVKVNKEREVKEEDGDGDQLILDEIEDVYDINDLVEDEHLPTDNTYQVELDEDELLLLTEEDLVEENLVTDQDQVEEENIEGQIFTPEDLEA